MAALNELAESEGRPQRLDSGYSIDAKEQHPMNVLDGTTWYEGLRRDVFDAHRERAAADLDLAERQQRLDELLEMVEFGPYGLEQRLGTMGLSDSDPPGAVVNGKISPEALAGRRAACQAWIDDPTTQRRHAEWSERRRTNQSSQQTSGSLPFYAEVYQAGQRSMRLDLGRQSSERLDRVAWQVRTFGLSHAEEQLRSPGVTSERLGEAGIAGREQVLSQWYTDNWRRGMGGLDAELAATQQQTAQREATEQTAAGQGGTDQDQALRAAMSGRPDARVVARRHQNRPTESKWPPTAPRGVTPARRQPIGVRLRASGAS